MWEMKKTLVLEIYLIEGGVFIALERSSFPSPDHLILRCIGCCSWSFCYLNFSIKELFLCDVLWISPGVVLGLLVRICIDKPKLFLIKKILSIQSGHPKEIAVASKDKTSAGCKHYVIDFHELFHPGIFYGETLLKID